ncbi:metallophosphoesterase [Thiocystis violascens]|uniref:Putative phosphohydrolase n=1 Tax=Thiocystis violascens (strain ATCC 17096 / DSM 198 / 6111) TaxID=765911 RepID=I3Y6E3_THIV6|nr:metallophosphoesterase [Thiocystis violascens]AFL72561.1 putative phosphohydrolase [Thiocystis violascens DSM 198]
MSMLPEVLSTHAPGQDPSAASNAADPLRLVQLTDPHLFGNPAGRLLGITTRISFEAVLAHVLANSQPVDALILTGDLVHDESPAGYRYLRQALDGSGQPYYCIAGNHDRHDPMREYLGCSAVETLGIRRIKNWSLIFLDSLNPGRNSGLLPHSQLDQLRGLLARNQSPSLIFLHHHPIPVHSTWMDTMGAENGGELLRICALNPQVKAVVFGHIHQAFSSVQGDCRILGTPSTCIQFLPGSREFALDDRPPGYRELMLYPDGRLETQVIRLDEFHESPTPHSAGY